MTNNPPPAPAAATAAEPLDPCLVRLLASFKRKPSRSERRDDFRDALFEFDPYTAQELDAYVSEQYVPDELKPLDQIAWLLRNERYAVLGSARATALFAERYQLILDCPDLEWEGHAVSGLEKGLIHASLTNFRHMWASRQQADFLGMEYDDYIRGVFLVHHSLGNTLAPSPRQMHGPMATASAALEKKTNELALQRYLDN